MADVFDEIRSAARAVAETAVWVRVDRAAIPAYAEMLPQEAMAAAALDPATHYLGQGEDTVAFILALDAINFGSGYFPCIRKRPGLSPNFFLPDR